MTCGDDGRVVLVVKGGAAEVNEPHRGVIYSPLIAFLKEEGCGKGAGHDFLLKSFVLSKESVLLFYFWI